MDNFEKFDLSNYQVVRQEFVDDAQEIYFSFNMGKAYINGYGLSLFREEYIQIYVDQERKNMVIKPLPERKKDSFRWSGTGKKRKPRHMRCTPLYIMVFMMMDWDIYSRYRITGYIEQNGEERVLYFDLKNAVRFKTEEEKEMTLKLDRNYPEQWRNSFGIFGRDHVESSDIKIFDDCVEFDVELKLNRKNKEKLQNKVSEDEGSANEKVNE